MSDLQERATVHLVEPPHDQDGVFSEWVHESGLAWLDHGLELRWETSPIRSWIPYSNVSRIDFQPCHCPDCNQRRQEAAE